MKTENEILIENGFKETEIGLIPEDWEVVKIDEYVQFERGTEPGSDNYNKDKHGIRFLRVVDISGSRNDGIYTTSKNIKLCHEDDVLIAFDGSPGIVKRGLCGAYSSGIRKVVNKSKDLLQDFVYYVLQTHFVQRTIEKYTTGVTIKHASKAIPNIKIPLPPLPEQKKIAYVLSKIQDAIEQQEKLIQITKELKKSLMNKLFTEGLYGEELKETEIGLIPKSWEVVSLNHIAEIKSGKRLPKGLELVEQKTPYPYIRIVDMRNNSVELSKIKYLLPEIRDKIQKYIITSQDIYISIAGTIGMVGIIPPELDGANLTENAARLVTKDKSKISQKFFMYFLASPAGQTQIKALTSKTSQPKLAISRIKTI